MLNFIKNLFLFGEDAASEQEVIENIERGVDFRGAKLWILVIAVLVASLGLNTNSAAVIIGAMLISPLMGPITGMGLGAGIYDFELLRRSWRNFIVATIFSITTATVYFLITPIDDAKSELLARTSPTIYDVLIALCGGLAGIIALSSHSQKSGNVIPGVAIATALMPPLCTVGFGLATANWAYAAGALYLFLINTIFIAFATLIGAVFIMKFEKKAYINHQHETKVKRIIYSIAIVTMLPAVILTIGMVKQSYFERHVIRFINQEMHFPKTQIVSHHIDYDARTFSVVMIGQEVDSTSLRIAREHLPIYDLEGVEMHVVQSAQNEDLESFRQMLLADSKELHNAEAIITQQQMQTSELDHQLRHFTMINELAPQLLKEIQVLFPDVEQLTLARGTTVQADNVQETVVALIVAANPLTEEDNERITLWLKHRIGEQDIIVVEPLHQLSSFEPLATAEGAGHTSL